MLSCLRRGEDECPSRHHGDRGARLLVTEVHFITFTFEGPRGQGNLQHRVSAGKRYGSRLKHVIGLPVVIGVTCLILWLQIFTPYHFEFRLCYRQTEVLVGGRGVRCSPTPPVRSQFRLLLHPGGPGRPRASRLTLRPQAQDSQRPHD